MPASPLKTLRQSLENDRRTTLGFCRALDHIGFPPNKLEWTSLHALHERDADAAELLYGIERGHITAKNVTSYRQEADKLRTDAERLRAKVRAALPMPYQQRLDLAIPVASSTITTDDIYDEIRAAP